YQKTGHGHLVYYVFDVLYLDGHDLRGLPLARRKQILQGFLPTSKHIRASEHIDQHGVAFFDAVTRQGLEGIVAKRAASPYRTGRRSQDWLKIKAQQKQQAVIGGFTEPRGNRRHLGSLLLGVYDGPNLQYIGRAGGGFTDEDLQLMRLTLDPLVRK